MARLVLVGLPGVGKTSVAQALALQWGCEAVDTDDELALAVGCPASRYLREHGEEAFRDRELEALHAVVADDVVVATGGGIVCTPSARELLADELTVWLDCDDGSLAARVVEGDRPLLGDDHETALARLRAQRTDLYREVARVRVDASGPLQDVVRLVAEQVQGVSS